MYIADYQISQTKLISFEHLSLQSADLHNSKYISVSDNRNFDASAVTW